MKLLYYLYATLAAGVDAMQSLVRMLCGLEQYSMDTGSGSTIETTGDPLSNFILGVLGIGETSEVYSALNTVFWSLAVFALIILAITTMVAMVKAHYNEDTQQTNPWTYIYTAGKAIFTFAFIPIVTIIGFQLTSFVLQTLDNITAGAGNSGQIVELYGTGGQNALRSNTDKNGRNTYANYDMFGNLSPTSTTTFSGMLFNASMYGANRLRNGQVSVDQVASTMNGLFANDSCSAYESLTNDVDRRAYVANQVDYAFANSLALSGSYSWDNLKGVFEDTFIIGKLDPFKTNSITGFYKFHASVIWAYYDLMQFNFIVGFAGVFTTFGIMLSIVLALVSRLIKGVALFLVYPTLLGIAPMDNFKAFKSWGTNFMQQIMMAFGSIIGINLLLLILPYVQNFKFFDDIDLLNYIMNVIMLVVGLVMAKDFMSMVSGFVGGADANQTGEGMKGDVSNKIKQGVTGGARVVGGALRIGASAATAPIRAGKKIAKGVRSVKNWSQDVHAKRIIKKETKAGREAQSDARRAISSSNANIESSQNNIASLQNNNQALSDALRNHETVNKIISSPIGLTKEQRQIRTSARKAYDDAIKSGMTEEQAKEIERNSVVNQLGRNSHDRSFQALYRKNNKQIAANNVSITSEQSKIENENQNIANQNQRIKDNSFESIVKSHTAKADNETEIANKIAELRSKSRYAGKSDVELEGIALKKLSKSDQRWAKHTKDLGYDEYSGKVTGNTAVRDGLKDNFTALVKKINEGIDGMSLGRTMADSFAKTIEGVGSGLGLDKVIKAATDEMGKSLTYKGGAFKPIVQGDALQKKQHAEIMKQDKAQTEALKDIKAAIQELRKDTNKNAQEARNNKNNNS